MKASAGTWAEAYKACKDHNLQLATVDSKEKLYSLMALRNLEDTTRYVYNQKTLSFLCKLFTFLHKIVKRFMQRLLGLELLSGQKTACMLNYACCNDLCFAFFCLRMQVTLLNDTKIVWHRNKSSKSRPQVFSRFWLVMRLIRQVGAG